MIEEKISVIIPIYNGEKYIENCINSLLKQTYSNLEIIIINDGSTDNSFEILNQYRHHKKIKIHTQNNQGNSAARNLGIDLSKSKYLTSVDIDDWLEQDCIELLYSNIVKYDADISCCGFYKNFIGREVPFFSDNEVVLYSRKAALNAILLDHELQSHPWGKLYKTSLFENTKFPLNRFYEDYAVLYKVINNCDTIVKQNTPKYHYVQRANSLSNSNTATKELHLFLGALERFEFALNNREVISDWKEYTDYNHKLIFRTIKTIIRLSKDAHIINEAKKNLADFIDRNNNPFQGINISQRIMIILFFKKTYLLNFYYNLKKKKENKHYKPFKF